jgi:predicted RNA-binding Zn-ribbon protein involved in translation (DUF1610 family)
MTLGIEVHGLLCYSSYVGMSCPNCGSSKVRRSKRSAGERIFLTMLVTRPFRCEDCIGRFFSWVWQAPDGSSLSADPHSLVYTSPTAALHSSHSRSRRKTHKHAYPAAAFQPAPHTGFLRNWLKKPIITNAPSPSRGFKPRVMPEPRAESLPEILGVILEIKHQTS